MSALRSNQRYALVWPFLVGALVGWTSGMLAGVALVTTHYVPVMPNQVWLLLGFGGIAWGLLLALPAAFGTVAVCRSFSAAVLDSGVLAAGLGPDVYQRFPTLMRMTGARSGFFWISPED